MGCTGNATSSTIKDDSAHHFKLYDRALAAGVVSTGNGLVVVPTATGKSYIGRAVIKEAIRRRHGGFRLTLFRIVLLLRKCTSHLNTNCRKKA